MLSQFFCLTISNNILREGYHTRTFLLSNKFGLSKIIFAQICVRAIGLRVARMPAIPMVAIVVFDDILLLAKDDKLGRENKGG